MSDELDDEARRETRDFILRWTPAGIDRARGDMAALDDKAAKVFAAAGVVIGLAGLTSVDSLNDSWVVAALLIGAVAAFAVVALLTIAQLRPVKYRGYEHAQDLWTLYGSYPVEVTKDKLVAEIPEVFEQTQRAAQEKAKRLRLLLYAASTEILLVGAAVVARLLQ